MDTKKSTKMHALRMRVKMKSTLKIALCLIFFLVLSVGVYNIARWGVGLARYCYHTFVLDDISSIYNYSLQVGQEYMFYENGAKGYIQNNKTRKIILKNVNWIAGTTNTIDTLLCFASNGYRGYLNSRTGRVVIPANKYQKAWLFSEGLAAVMEKDSVLKFINTIGETVIDKHFKYSHLPVNQGYLFKNGYCIMSGTNQQWGLIDKEGKWVVNPEYDNLTYTKKKYWICYKNGKKGLLNDSLHLVLQPDYREVLVTDNGIEVLKEDYTRQFLDYNGNVIEHYLYTDVRNLYYKSEIIDPDFEEYEYILSLYMEYQTTYSTTSPKRVGLMGPDGRPVTPPLYVSITAIGADCFRCYYSQTEGYHQSEGASILIDGKGKLIE